MSEVMSLAELMAAFRCGDEHSWPAEFNLLRKNHGGRLRTLFGSILRTGIRTPILLGNDGRVWDGHHRIYVAHALGFKSVPVEHARSQTKETRA